MIAGHIMDIKEAKNKLEELCGRLQSLSSSAHTKLLSLVLLTSYIMHHNLLGEQRPLIKDGITQGI